MLRTRRSFSFLTMSCLAALSSIPVALAHDATRETVLHAFMGNDDGATPSGTLAEDGAGNFYGTTPDDGAYGHGMVFKLSPDGTLSSLHAFGAFGDGVAPFSGVIQDKAGNLFGTTYDGGYDGHGTVFEVTPDGTETLLHVFSGNDGEYLNAGVTIANHRFYGVTSTTVFQLKPSGAFKVLHTFTGGADGRMPMGLVSDKSGNLYGTTAFGGEGDYCYSSGGCGVIYKITPNGTVSVIYTFGSASSTDGYNPYSSLILDKNGTLYGTTRDGGTLGYGTVFALTAAGTETVLYSFQGYSDGAYPNAPLLLHGGTLYGTTAYGGLITGCSISGGCGTVFKLSVKSGAKHTLYTFQDGSDGASPYSSLVMDKQGLLSGTTENGGNFGCGNAYGCGVIFSLKR